MPALRAIPPLVALALVVGCGKPAPPGPVEVAGQVEDSSGKPLTKVLVRFNGHDESNKGLQIQSFPTGDEGRFTGKCLPGKYKVTLFEVPVHQGGEPGKGAPAPAGKGLSGKIPRQYTSPNETPWVVEVPAGGKKDFVFKLE